MNEKEIEIVDTFLTTIQNSLERGDQSSAISACKILKRSINGDDWDDFVDMIISVRREIADSDKQE